MTRSHRAALIAVALIAAVPVVGRAAVAPTPPAVRLPAATGTEPLDAALGEALGCDELDPVACLLPFPNDAFTRADPTTDTGLRVDFDVTAMPRNVAGLPVDPTEWNRNDGFSPGSMVLTQVPGLDLHATWGSGLDHIQDLSWYERPDAPIVLLDADTGERHPFWSELDSHADDDPANQLLILRPASNLLEGHRYVVALRDLRRSDGSLIPAGPTFAAYRDGTAAPGVREERRAHLE